MLDEVLLAEHLLNVMFPLFLTLFIHVVVLFLQGRPGPKGDAGDSGLPGQKVSAALAQNEVFKQERGIIHSLTTNLARVRTQTAPQLGRIHRGQREDGSLQQLSEYYF